MDNLQTRHRQALAIIERFKAYDEERKNYIKKLHADLVAKDKEIEDLKYVIEDQAAELEEAYSVTDESKLIEQLRDRRIKLNSKIANCNTLYAQLSAKLALCNMPDVERLSLEESVKAVDLKRLRKENETLKEHYKQSNKIIKDLIYAKYNNTAPEYLKGLMIKVLKLLENL